MAHKRTKKFTQKPASHPSELRAAMGNTQGHQMPSRTVQQPAAAPVSGGYETAMGGMGC